MSQAPKVLRCSVCQRELPADATDCPEHGATLVEVDPLLDRIISRRYRLVRCVGRGGMGAVYEGRHVHTEQRVAVKVLAPHLSRDLKLVARFRREAMATSRLRHENCVQVHDFGEDDDGTFFIAMELVDGRGIGDDIRRTGPVPPERVARVGVQLLGALEAAHAASILHRDLKPQNIMLTQKVGRPDLVKVVDFGIAKFVENSPEDQVALTLPGTIFGTPEYMSPEQARGEPLDGRSDLYSAAVVLWHMLLGRSPYRGKTVRETLMKVFREEPPRPSEERSGAGVSVALEEALLVALQKEPEDRYPDAARFRAALLPFVGARQRPGPSGLLSGTSQDGTPPPATVGMDADPEVANADTRLSTGPRDGTQPHVRAGEDLPPEDGPSRTTQDHDAFDPRAPDHEAVAEGESPPKPSTGPAGAPVAADAETAPLDAPSTEIAAPAAQSASEEASCPSPSSPDRPRAAPPPTSFSLLTLLLLVVGGGAIGGLGLGAVAYGIFRAVTEAPQDPTSEGRAELGSGQGQGTAQDAPVVEDGGWAPLEGFPAAKPSERSPDEALLAASRALAGEDLDAAAAAYREALRGNPSSPAAHQGLAMVAYRQGDLATAKTHLEELMQLDPRYATQLKGFHAMVTKRLEAEQR